MKFNFISKYLNSLLSILWQRISFTLWYWYTFHVYTMEPRKLIKFDFTFVPYSKNGRQNTKILPASIYSQYATNKYTRRRLRFRMRWCSVHVIGRIHNNMLYDYTKSLPPSHYEFLLQSGIIVKSQLTKNKKFGSHGYKLVYIRSSLVLFRIALQQAAHWYNHFSWFI